MNNAQWLYDQVPGPDDEDEGVHLSSAHALLIAGELTRGFEAESKLSSESKIVEAYEHAMVALREALGLSGHDEHELVLDEIKRLVGRLSAALLEIETLRESVMEYAGEAQTALGRLDSALSWVKVFFANMPKDRRIEFRKDYDAITGAVVETNERRCKIPDCPYHATVVERQEKNSCAE